MCRWCLPRQSEEHTMVKVCLTFFQMFHIRFKENSKHYPSFSFFSYYFQTQNSYWAFVSCSSLSIKFIINSQISFFFMLKSLYFLVDYWESNRKFKQFYLLSNYENDKNNILIVEWMNDKELNFCPCSKWKILWTKRFLNDTFVF